MDEQRLERALRAGPPFATAYVARPLVLEQPAVARWPLRRLALLLALTALLLAGAIVGALVGGVFRPSPLAVVVRQDATCAGSVSFGLCADTLSILYPDGHEQTIFPPAGSGSVDIPPDLVWSPDERQLAVTARSLSSGVPDDWGLYLVDADDGDVRLLRSAEQGWCGFPSWSPDGRTLACTSFEEGADGGRSLTRLQAVNVANGTSTELASLPGGQDSISSRQYRWSPDSEWLMYLAETPSVGFEGSAEPGGGLPSAELWVVRRDGSDRQRLLAAVDMPLVLRTIEAYRWSPGSDAVAFGKPTTAQQMIRVVRLNGSRSEIVPPLAPLMPDGSSAVRPARVEVLAWSRPDEITYGAGGKDWLFVATTKLDGTAGDVLLDWESSVDVPYQNEYGVRWEDLWLSADGRTLHWWSSACLMAAERGDRHPRTEYCVNTNYLAKAVGDGALP